MFENLRAWMAIYCKETTSFVASDTAVAPKRKLPIGTVPAASAAGSAGGISSLEDIAAAFYGTLLRPQQRESSLSSEMETAIYKEVLTVIRAGVKPDDLPKLPTAVVELLQMLRDEDATNRDMVLLINREPVLASEVVKAANSAYYRSGDGEVTSVEQAVSRLGVDRLSTITLAILMRPAFEIKPIYFRFFSKYLWQHSQDCAVACAELARQAGEDYFTAYLIGLVHDIGKLVIFQALMRAMKSAHPDVHPNPTLIGTIVDRTSLQLSCVSLKHWELPGVVQRAVCEQVNTGREPTGLSRLGELLFSANLLSEFHLLLSDGRLDDEQADRLLQPYGISAAMVHSLFRDPA